MKPKYLILMKIIKIFVEVMNIKIKSTFTNKQNFQTVFIYEKIRTSDEII